MVKGLLHGFRTFLRTLAAFCALLLLPLAPMSAQAEETQPSGECTAESTFSLPESKATLAARLTDGRYNSRVTFTKDETLVLTPAAGARGLYVAWHTVPAACIVSALDASGAALAEFIPEETLLNAWYALPEGTTEVRFTGKAPYAVSEVRVYASETPPEGLAVLKPPKTEPSVLLLLAHTGDEAFYFGSLLPYCASDEVALAFLMSESRQAQQEAIELQYALGAQHQPIFADFPYYRAYMDNAKMYQLHKKADVEAYMITLLRAYRPEVLVTHASEGENGDCMHALAAAHALLGAQKAAEPLAQRESAAQYGAWQVQSVFEHRSEGEAPLYDTELPLLSHGDRSARELAEAGYARYTFLAQYHQTVTDTPYFVQTWTAGEAEPALDERKSAEALFALLESLSPQVGPSLLASAATPTPAPAPTAAPTPTPLPLPAETASPVQADAARQSGAGAFLAIGLALLGCGVALFTLLLLLRRRDTLSPTLRRRLLVSASAALLVGGLLTLSCALRGCVAQKDAPAAPKPPAASGMAAPAPSAAPAPTAAPTPAPSPTPHPFTAHFRQESDPAEVVLFDTEKGEYAYRSDTLAVEITRHSQETPPAVWFVAHIYMRDEDAYRSGFGSQRQNGRDSVDAAAMARSYRAVLGITGDNLVHADFNKKGLAIRDGRLYCAETIESVMILTDDLSMRVYESEDKTMLQEIDDGVKTTYTFGPPLVLDGAPYAKMDYHRVSPQNPRVGLGFVEKGHFVAIVVDGRLPGYSHGMLLPDFANLFLEEGCVMAYNLDGGASASMVFMGEYLNLRSSGHYRRVPDLLLWGYSERVLSPDAEPLYTGLIDAGN